MSYDTGQFESDFRNLLDRVENDVRVKDEDVVEIVEKVLQERGYK